MNDEYKVIFQLLDANDEQVTEWMTKPQAVKYFKHLKKNNNCIYAELLYSPIDGDPNTGEIVVAEFTNNVIEVLGKKILVPNKEVK